jgi:restriction system protein
MNHETADTDNRLYGAKSVYLGRRATSNASEDDPDTILVGNRGWRLDLSTYQLIHDGEGLATVDSADPSVLLKSVLLEFEGSSEEGRIVKRPRATWFEISKHLRKSPEFRFAFPAEPRAFEEFLAGMYHVNGWSAVTLTPQSNDKGRDVIAVTAGLITSRVLVQAKAYRKNRVVLANDVRALYGVLVLDQDASKGIVTTTSDFAPGIASEFSKVLSYQLELKSGSDFIEWVEMSATKISDGRSVEIFDRDGGDVTGSRCTGGLF